MEAVKDQGSVDQPNGNVAESPTAFSYRLVVVAIISVTVAFILVMGVFALIEVFNEDNAANITAALSSLFGIVGTLVGAYFGIKASSDAQDRSADTAKQAVTDQKETAHKAVEDQKNTVQQTIDKTVAAAAPQQTPQGTRGTNPVSRALATLIPVAGGASLLALHHYLRRK